jgi:hypothetical protein
MKVTLTLVEDQMDKFNEICFQLAIEMNFKIFRFTTAELIGH